jgi:CHAD domain-containing protein
MSEAVQLGSQAEARKARTVELDPTWPASTGFVHVAAECIDHWRSNEPLLLQTRAMPHLHQTRVGIRRLRSTFSLFRPLLADVPGAFLIAHRLRSLAVPFGTARDLDVLLAGPLVKDLDRTQVARLAADREAAYDVVHAVLRSPDWAEVGRSLDGLLLLAPWPGVSDPPLPDLAVQALDKRWERVVSRVDRLATMSAEQRHRVRIDAKKLRYGCEFFASLFGPERDAGPGGAGEPSPALAFAARVEEVQGALGVANDHDAADGILRGVGAHAPKLDEHRLVEDAVTAVRELAALDPFWR